MFDIEKLTHQDDVWHMTGIGQFFLLHENLPYWVEKLSFLPKTPFLQT